MRDAAKYIKRPRLEHVEIPYDGTSLPAIYVHAEPAKRGGKVPAMVFFDGLDVTKEIQYFKGVADLVARGIACLIVDGPGNGESIRFRNLYLRARDRALRDPGLRISRRAARRSIAKRIGVMAISLGGYYAPRAAAFEPRYACCIAWGAQWDYQKIWRERFERLANAPIRRRCRSPRSTLLWVLERQVAGRGAQAARAVQARRRRAEDHLPVPDAARRGRRADSAGRGAEVLRRGRLEAEDAEGVHARGRRLPPLPDRQPDDLLGLYVGLARAGAAAGEMTPVQGCTLLIGVDVVVLDHLAPAGDLALEEFFARGGGALSFGYGATPVSAHI